MADSKPKTRHERLVCRATRAVDQVYADITVPRSTTLESLANLQSFIEECIAAIVDDERAEQESSQR